MEPPFSRAFSFRWRIPFRPRRRWITRCRATSKCNIPTWVWGTSRYAFKVDVQDTNWVISSKPLNQRTEAASEWIVAHFDDRIFGLTRLADAALSQMNRTSRVENVAFAEVHNGWQPAAVSSLVSRISFVWFGCAPHNDLADGKVSLKPVWATPEGHNHELVRAFLKTHVSEPHLPANAAFVAPNRQGWGDVSNFLYRVTVWTNVAGFEFPAEFLGQRYAQNEIRLVATHGVQGSGNQRHCSTIPSSGIA